MPALATWTRYVVSSAAPCVHWASIGGRLAGRTTPSSGYSIEGAAEGVGSGVALPKLVAVAEVVPGPKTLPVRRTVSGACAVTPWYVALTMVLPPLPERVTTPSTTMPTLAPALQNAVVLTSCSAAPPTLAKAWNVTGE